MRKGLFVTGTDTNVGKTWVTAALAAYTFRKLGGLPSPVEIWKPVQSGVQLGDPDADSFRLAYGSGLPQTEPETVTITLREPLAPWVAAEREGKTIGWAALESEGRRRMTEGGPLLVEGAGGLLVPLTGDRTVADLALALGLPLLIVARATLGTVNHTLMTIECARSRGLDVAGVILNGYEEENDASLVDNVRMIERFGGTSVWATLPWMPMERMPSNPIEWGKWRNVWTELLEERLRWNEIRRFFEGEPMVYGC
ncbi:dethiobiotin synthase [Paenibacillus validus]|uniref:dethiobiotin synthase n=1 Tax=Paenibacillus validus TaxID=44253 RepID=UPI003D291835